MVHLYITESEIILLFPPNELQQKTPVFIFFVIIVRVVAYDRVRRCRFRCAGAGRGGCWNSQSTTRLC